MLSKLSPIVVHAPLPYSIRPYAIAAIWWLIVSSAMLTASAGLLFAVISVPTGLLFILVLEHARFERRFEHRATINDDAAGGIVYSDVYDEIFHKLELSIHFMDWLAGRRWSWKDLIKEARGRAVDVPNTIVDSAIAKELAEIAVPDHALQPVLIYNKTRHIDLQLLFLGGAASYVLFQNVFVVTLTLIILAVFCWLRWRLAVVLPDFLMPRAGVPLWCGMGTVSDLIGDRKWDPSSSMLVVQQIRNSRKLHLTLVGQSGVRQLRVSGVNDADLAILWRHWNHPAPRLELIFEPE